MGKENHIKHDIQKISTLLEAFSLDAIEEAVRQRKARTVVHPRPATPELATALIAIADQYHQAEVANDKLDESSMAEFYTIVMQTIYGPNYFDAIVDIHGSDYVN